MRNLYASELHAPDAFDVSLQEIEVRMSEQLAQNFDETHDDKNLAQIVRYIKFIVGKMAADNTYRNINQDWEELGRVIDRCLFLIFLTLYIFTASSLL